MTLNPQKLRSLSSGETFVGDEKDAPMIADALEIADSCARADIESYCKATGEGADYREWSWDTSTADEDDSEAIAQALRYLDARGLIERDTNRPELVRFKPA